MKRAQIFFIGASSTYGVGGTQGGWPDLLKKELHNKMYAADGIGQMHEVYNLGIPGAVLAELEDRCQLELKVMRKPNRVVVSVVQLSANDSKAVGSPENYVSTPENFRSEAKTFLEGIKNLSDVMICIGSRPMDQEKVMPIVKDNEKNTNVYFPNERIALFEDIAAEICEEIGIIFLPTFRTLETIDPDGSMRYEDGLHPNDEGYEWTHNLIKEELSKHITL